jgi:predicted extracellular nuclease
MKAKLLLAIVGLGLISYLPTLAATNHMVINQIQISGDGGANDEYIELYNPTGSAISLKDWSIQYKTPTGVFPLGSKRNLPDVQVPAGKYFLIANTGYNGSVTPDLSHSSFGMASSETGGTVFLVNKTAAVASATDSAIVDKVGYGNAATNAFETANAPLPDTEKSIARVGDDTDNNSTNFQVGTSTPHNSASTGSTNPTPTPTPTPIPEPTPVPTPTPTPNPTPTPSAFALNVVLAGTGAGVVTSTPSGINCGNTCSKSFDEDASVQLSAAAATGSTFLGWSGACTGTSICSVTMSADKSVTATFALDQVTQPDPEPEPVQQSIEINEVFPSPVSSSKLEFVELKNTGSSAVNLLGWTVAFNGQSYTFSENVVLEAGEVYAVYKGESKIELNINKSRKLVLKDAANKDVEQVDIGWTFRGRSMAKFGDNFAWSKIVTPDSQNLLME